MTFSDARAECLNYDMSLPLPFTTELNEKFSKIGESWINIIGNNLLDVINFENFRQTQRSYLKNSSYWEIVNANERLPFFCVKFKTEKCSTIFHSR
jgi:hypothetical protein